MTKYTTGNILKQYRLDNGFTYKDVCDGIGIIPEDLQNIEAETIKPTWEQIKKLSSIYNQDEEWIFAQIVSDEAIKYSDSENNNTIFSNLQSEKNHLPYHFFELENRRYIGSKAKLTDWIVQTIKHEVPRARSFCDIFAGTGVVANRAITFYDRVIVNDILSANNVIYGGFFAQGKWNTEKLNSLIENYNTIDPSSIEDNWFSENYGGKYFSNEVAKIIGYVRQDIEDKRSYFTVKEYDILLSSLIYSIDRLANTVGHFDAYIKKEIQPHPFVMRMINAQSLQNVQIYNEDANELAKEIQCDIVYLDPPYNSRQYCRFYHVYETLVKWDKPKLYGVALKPKAENMSVYCTTKAVEAFEDIIKTVDAKVLAVSYNNTYNSKSKSSKNKIRLSQIKRILDERGATTVYEHNHKFFNAGKTEFDNHKEFLFVTKIK